MVELVMYTLQPEQLIRSGQFETVVVGSQRKRSCLMRSLGNRQANRKDTAFTESAMHSHFTIMCLDDVLDN